MKALALVAALALAACSTAPAYRAQVPGQPRAYSEGYTDGCPSGEAAGGYINSRFRKDAARAVRDPLYASGWNDGFAVCKGRYQSAAAIFR